MPEERLARVRREPSPIRHSRARAESPVRAFALDFGPATLVPPATAGWSNLVMTRSGALSLRARDPRSGVEIATIVAPGTGAWVPAGCDFGVRLHGRCELRIAYVAPGACAARELGPVVVTELASALFERIYECGYVHPDEPREARLIDLFCDELDALAGAPPLRALRLPRDPLLRAAAERALETRESAPTVAALVATSGYSTRAFERRFVAETGMPPRTWLRAARIGFALAALEGGASVTEAALASGYASLSAFVAAYRSLTGVTPGTAARRGRTPTPAPRTRRAPCLPRDP